MAHSTRMHALHACTLHADCTGVCSIHAQEHGCWPHPFLQHATRNTTGLRTPALPLLPRPQDPADPERDRMIARKVLDNHRCAGARQDESTTVEENKQVRAGTCSHRIK